MNCRAPQKRTMGVGKVIGRAFRVAKRVGGFVARHHGDIANVAHGIANMAGNATAQKVTGLALDASRAATALRGMGGGAPAAPAGMPPG
jgi:hypothetical protein